MTHPDVGYSEAEAHMLVTEEVVEIRVLRRQGKSIREIAQILDVLHHSTIVSINGESYRLRDKGKA
jgi:IS30 family transposase